MLRLLLLLFCILLLETCVQQPPQLFPIFEQGKYGFMNANGEVVIQPQFKIHGIQSLSPHEIFPSQVIDSLYNLVDSPNPFTKNYPTEVKGINEFQSCYPNCEVGPFIDNRAAVNCPLLFGSGFIDTSGNPISSFKYWGVSDYQEGIAIVASEPQDIYLVDSNEQKLMPKRFNAAHFNHFIDGLLLVNEKGRWGYLNQDGEYIWQEDLDLLHRELDLSAWELDTLNEYYIVENEKRIGNRNTSKLIPLKSEINYKPNGVGIYVDTSQLTHFAYEFYANKIFLYNTSPDTFSITSYSGSINLILQGWDEFCDQWINLERFMKSFCSTERSLEKLPKHHHWAFAAPLCKGNMSTSLRYKLTLDNDSTLYSNTYCGEIHSDWIRDGKERKSSTSGASTVWIH